jgi:hypothetical protein
MMNPMKNILANLRSAAIISFLLVLPFAILEFMFNIAYKPTALSLKKALDLTVLFGLLWLLPVTFITILLPMVRNVQVGNRIMARPIHFLLSVAFLALIAIMWGGIVIDQWPCFIGVPKCD